MSDHDTHSPKSAAERCKLPTSKYPVSKLVNLRTSRQRSAIRPSQRRKNPNVQNLPSRHIQVNFRTERPWHQRHYARSVEQLLRCPSASYEKPASSRSPTLCTVRSCGNSFHQRTRQKRECRTWHHPPPFEWLNTAEWWQTVGKPVAALHLLSVYNPCEAEAALPTWKRTVGTVMLQSEFGLGLLAAKVTVCLCDSIHRVGLREPLRRCCLAIHVARFALQRGSFKGNVATEAAEGSC